MSLIGALLAGTVAYKREKERLANKAESDGKRDQLDFGPGLSFDESDAISESFSRLARQKIGSMPKELPTVTKLRTNFPDYSPSK